MLVGVLMAFNALVVLKKSIEKLNHLLCWSFQCVLIEFFMIFIGGDLGKTLNNIVPSCMVIGL
jgi:hypothetical protein